MIMITTIIHIHNSARNDSNTNNHVNVNNNNRLHDEAKYFQAVAVWFRWFQRLILVNAHDATLDVYKRMLHNATNDATFRSEPAVLFTNGTTVLVKQTLGCDPGPLHPYGDFYRMTMSDRLELFREHPWTFVIGAVCLLLLLLGSHTGSVIHSRFFYIGEGEGYTIICYTLLLLL